MAGNWYMGGVLRTEKTANAWINDTMRASLIAGTSVTQNDRGWTTMGEFTGAGNSFIENMTSGVAINVLIPGTRTITYDTGTDTVYWRWPAGQVSFGTPESGQNYCGVLIHEGLTTDPSATIWGYQRVIGSTLGGPVTWGEAGSVNDVLTANARNTLNANTGNGFMQGVFNDRVDSWSGTTDTYYEFALVQSGNTVNFRDWYSVQDAINAGITFCTNCGFDQNSITGGANPLLEDTYRDVSDFFGGGAEPYFFYPTVNSGVPGGLKWNGSLLTGGETAIGVLGYVLGPAGPISSPIMMWNDINPSIQLANNQDVIWDSFDGGARSLVLTYLTGN